MEILQERFEAWLFSQPLGRVIETGNPHDCYLCSFLKETTSITPTFFYDDWFIGNSHQGFNPDWARQLINPQWTHKQTAEPQQPITVAQMQARYRKLFPDSLPEPDQPAPNQAIIADAVKK